jgi:hypothetical protein
MTKIYRPSKPSTTACNPLVLLELIDLFVTRAWLTCTLSSPRSFTQTHTNDY